MSLFIVCNNTIITPRTAQSLFHKYMSMNKYTKSASACVPTCLRACQQASLSHNVMCAAHMFTVCVHGVHRMYEHGAA